MFLSIDIYAVPAVLQTAGTVFFFAQFFRLDFSGFSHNLHKCGVLYNRTRKNGYDPPKSAFICRLIYPVSLSGENHIKDLSLGSLTPTVRGNPQ